MYNEVPHEKDATYSVLDFFDFVFQGKEPLYGFEEDMETLKLIDSLEGER